MNVIPFRHKKRKKPAVGAWKSDPGPTWWPSKAFRLSNAFRGFAQDRHELHRRSRQQPTAAFSRSLAASGKTSSSLGQKVFHCFPFFSDFSRIFQIPSDPGKSSASASSAITVTKLHQAPRYAKAPAAPSAHRWRYALHLPLADPLLAVWLGRPNSSGNAKQTF